MGLLVRWLDFQWLGRISYSVNYFMVFDHYVLFWNWKMKLTTLCHLMKA